MDWNNRFGHIHRWCFFYSHEGIVMLKREITRINKGIRLNTSARLPMDFSAPNNCLRLKKQGLDLNNPDIGHERRVRILTHRHDKRQETKLRINQTSSFFHNAPSRAEKDPTDLYLQAKERTMLSFSLRPLTKPIWKNNRRAWTEELHARFVIVLQMLGGPEVATPKRIRDRMQVDGLTIDQVKSHLQKYRINLRTGQPEVTAKKPRKLKFHLGVRAETSGAGSSMTKGNLV